jgi:hypothetical protein
LMLFLADVSKNGMPYSFARSCPLSVATACTKKKRTKRGKSRR